MYFWVMKLLLLIHLVLLPLLVPPVHPLHMSVTNITFENDKLVIEMKTFRDDWETSYFHYKGRQIDLTQAGMRESDWFTGYLETSFQLRTAADAKALELVIDSTVVDGESMQLYLHAGCREDVKTLYIYNSLLTDIFPDQNNLVIILSNGSQQGMKFDRNKLEAELSL